MIRCIAAGLALLLGLPTAAEAQKVSDDVVRMGLILDMSGPYSDVTGMGNVTGARMAVEDFGATVLGKRVEVVFADHQNKPDIAAAKAREWFDEGGVDMILDVSGSAAALAVQEIAKQRNKITIYSGPAAARLTNESCGPQTVHYALDTYAVAQTAAKAIVQAGYKDWFFVAVDYAFGAEAVRDTTAALIAAGGRSLGAVSHPLGVPDFSSFILQAQARNANVVAFANSGNDLVRSLKTAQEFGLTKDRSSAVAALIVFINDVHGMGLDVAKGILLAESFYWDQNPEARAWSARFEERLKKKPNSVNAGIYSSGLHYLKAVQSAGTDETDAVMAAMRASAVKDFVVGTGTIREDGRLIRDVSLYEVKTPAESKGAWDYYKLRTVIHGEEAFQPLSASRCPLIRKAP